VDWCVYADRQHKFPRQSPPALGGQWLCLQVLPSYDLRATGMVRNRFDNIWYAVRWSRQPPKQPDGMSSERYPWMLIKDFVANINKFRQRRFVPGGHLEADETVI
jgi:hypothetical protein